MPSIPGARDLEWEAAGRSEASTLSIMRLASLSTPTRAWLRRPGLWGAVGLFGLLWMAFRGFLGPPPEPSFLEVGLPFLFGAVLVLTAPWPWQWTGDERPGPGLGRGLVQSLALNGALVGLLLLLLPHPIPARGPGPGLGLGPGPGLGPGLGPGRGRGPGPPRVDLPGLPPLSARILLLGMASLGFGVLAGWVMAERDREAARADALDRTAREAQGRALQAQMSPHVLFNALSGLAELAREDPGATEAALVSMAELMRRLLVHAGRGLAPLSEERTLVEGFLDLEQFRLGERLQIRWHWDRFLESTEVPPLLLQPLVENALKHGIAPCRQGGTLEIGLEGVEGGLRLWVANTGLAWNPAAPERVGLSHLRARLALGRPPGRLELRREGARTLAEILLPGAHHG